MKLIYQEVDLKVLWIMLLAVLFVHPGLGQENGKKSKRKEVTLSFKDDVFPIISKNCLPCHAEDNFNPSELAMDSYDLIKAGGENGSPWVAGKGKESLLVTKVGEKPPFGERMPLNSKRKIKEGKAKWLSEEEIQAIATWIDQGAKNN